jgi:hypothetical protein
MTTTNEKLRNVAEIAAKIMIGEKLHPNQQKLDVHEPEKDELTSDDFKKLRAGKKPADMKKEEVKQIDEIGDPAQMYQKATETAKAKLQTMKALDKTKEYEKKRLEAAKLKTQKEEVEQIDEMDKSQPSSSRGAEGLPLGKKAIPVKTDKVKSDVLKLLQKQYKKADGSPKNEEVEQIQEYESKGGVYRHKGTYGTAKGAEYGETDYEKENEIAKKYLKPAKPARKKYGARQNYVRSTRVNESFSGLLSVYREGGLKALEEAMIKEEPTNDQYNAELNDNKAKAEGKKKQPDLAQGSIQAVKQEETEIAVIDADKANSVQIDTIDERQMTEPEMKKREEIVKSMKKGMAGFKERYGERAKNVMYATATKQAMKD